jgi:hypothetical protein
LFRRRITLFDSLLSARVAYQAVVKLQYIREKENSMYHLTDAQFLVGVLALLLVAVLGVRAIFDDRKAKSAPFRNYFDPGYRRELLRHSDLSEREDWQAERQSRFTPFRFRDQEAYRPEGQASGRDRRDREAN